MDARHTFFDDRLRRMLTGKIPGQQLDSLINTLCNLVQSTRPSVTLDKIFISVSEPSICDQDYCCCREADCRLKRYKISIYVDRREQGRRTTKPWVRVSSIRGFEDATRNLIQAVDSMIANAEGKEQRVEKEASPTCIAEVLSELETNEPADARQYCRLRKRSMY